MCHSGDNRTCSPIEHECGDGSCIPSFLRCDRVPHCFDGSDERNCTGKLLSKLLFSHLKIGIRSASSNDLHGYEFVMSRQH